MSQHVLASAGNDAQDSGTYYPFNCQSLHNQSRDFRFTSLSLPAMSLGDRFCIRQKGWDRGKWIGTLREAMSGLGCKIPSVGTFL